MIDVNELDNRLPKGSASRLRETVRSLVPEFGDQQFSAAHVTLVLRERKLHRNTATWQSSKWSVRKYLNELVEEGVLEVTRPPRKGKPGLYRAAQMIRPMSLEDEFTDGPYEGEQLEDVIEDHPNYVRTLLELHQVIFDEQAMAVMARRGLC